MLFETTSGVVPISDAVPVNATLMSVTPSASVPAAAVILNVEEFKEPTLTVTEVGANVMPLGAEGVKVMSPAVGATSNRK